MLSKLWRECWAVWRFRSYRPQPVTFGVLNRWLQQFEAHDRNALLELLAGIIYVSEEQTRHLLVKQNEALVQKLKRDGIPTNKIIYVQFDDAGSSSVAMLNMLKDSARLDSRCVFLDSKDIKGLHEVTKKLGEGAIIYVDDFIGTGTQFCRSHDYAAQYVIGTFAYFLLAPCVCEEALYKLGQRGIEAISGMIHSRADRPLHALNSNLAPDRKERLIELCHKINPRAGLGYKDMATMVVFYRNAPNTLPLVFRGSLKQTPFVGVLPRTKDLPPAV